MDLRKVGYDVSVRTPTIRTILPRGGTKSRKRIPPLLPSSLRVFRPQLFKKVLEMIDQSESVY